ncbi:phage portal protein [Thermobrachium celere]|uniref:phage portal protein n=1 Tax=Thermobrachium celere TaxID=53422 RepID=UPI0019439470|nr:phage portal protein [Thermobrachium celere]GFR36053.1 hypothetical protein TCEA9_18650 [Thermobrachium celere]
MNKQLLNYIKSNGYNANSWFVEEVQKIWHNDRVNEALAVREYLAGKHKVLDRELSTWNGKKVKTKAVVLQYAKSLLNFQTSFVLKNPVTLTSSDTKTLEVLKEIYNKSRYNLIDYKLLEKLIKFGEVYEYVYLDNEGIKSKIINKEDSYPVYDDKGNYIAFIEHYVSNGISYYTVYTDETVETYTDEGENLRKVGEYKNLSGLPIRYINPDDLDELKGRSDLEDYISILDTMEELISKYIDSFYKFLNPIPVLKGQRLIDKNKPSVDVAGQVLQLDEGANFDFAITKMDYQSLKQLFDILKQSLFDISCTPALTFNASEISNLSETSIKMLYSLAEVKASMIVNVLKQGFYDRFKAIARILKYMDIEINYSVVDVVFEFNVPHNATEIINNLSTLKEIGAISLETLLAQSPYVYDVADELKKLGKEGLSMDNNYQLDEK